MPTTISIPRATHARVVRGRESNKPHVVPGYYKLSFERPHVIQENDIFCTYPDGAARDYWHLVSPDMVGRHINDYRRIRSTRVSITGEERNGYTHYTFARQARSIDRLNTPDIFADILGDSPIDEYGSYLPISCYPPVPQRGYRILHNEAVQPNDFTLPHVSTGWAQVHHLFHGVCEPYGNQGRFFIRKEEHIFHASLTPEGEPIIPDGFDIVTEDVTESSNYFYHVANGRPVWIRRSYGSPETESPIHIHRRIEFPYPCIVRQDTSGTAIMRLDRDIEALVPEGYRALGTYLTPDTIRADDLMCPASGAYGLVPDLHHGGVMARKRWAHWFPVTPEITGKTMSSHLIELLSMQFQVIRLLTAFPDRGSGPAVEEEEEV